MDIAQVARTLGRRGGQARAARLSADDRRHIAALGGHARRRSLAMARRVAENFRYVDSVIALRGGPKKVIRMKTCAGKLPGLYQPLSQPRS